MAFVTVTKTAAQIITQIKADLARRAAAFTGSKIQKIHHVVTSAEDTAGAVVLATKLSRIVGKPILAIYSTAGVWKLTDQHCTVSGNVVTVADGTTVALAATDVIELFVSGE